MHVFLGGKHYLRVTATPTRARQIERYEMLGAKVIVEEVASSGVHPKAKLGRLVLLKPAKTGRKEHQDD